MGESEHRGGYVTAPDPVETAAYLFDVILDMAEVFAKDGAYTLEELRALLPEHDESVINFTTGKLYRLGYLKTINVPRPDTPRTRTLHISNNCPDAMEILHVTKYTKDRDFKPSTDFRLRR